MSKIVGIKFTAPVFDSSGYAEAARQYIVALHNKGIPVTVEPVSFEAARPELGETGELLNSLRDKNIPYNVKVIQLTPEHYPLYKEDNVLNVGYSFWETSALHKTWPGYINDNLQLCLVPCEWNKEVYINSGVTIPVRKVKQGIHTSEFENVGALNIAGLAEDTFMFYSIFQWTYRKNPEGLLRAYLASFQNNENVALVLKTYKSNFSPTEKELVRKLVAQCKYLMPTDNPPKIYLLLDLLSRDELLGVHKRGDCFVLPHRAEGWGMPHFEAGAMGNPVITTGMSGNMEFTTKENSYLIDYSWTPVSGMPWSLWYAGGQQWWAEPDLKQTSDYMKHVYNNREEAKTRGLALKNNIHTNFAWDSAVMDMINSIEEAL